MFHAHENTNARQTTNISPKMPFKRGTLPYFRRIANILVLGPNDLFVLRTSSPSDTKRHFERILQIVLRIPNTVLTSWAIFRQEREWNTQSDADHFGLVLRHSRWDIKADLAANTYTVQEAQPALSITTRFIADDLSADLVSAIQELDQMLVSGVTLEQRSQIESWEWDEISIFRAIDWGLINLSWSFLRQNTQCEAAAFRLAHIIETILKEHETNQSDTVEQIDMLYRAPYPETTEFLAHVQ